MSTEEKKVAMTVRIIKEKPNLKYAITNNGTFSRNTTVPMGVPSRWLSTVATPVKPPSRISFGAKNTLTAAAYKKPPAKYSSKSAAVLRAVCLFRFAFLCTVLRPVLPDLIKQRAKAGLIFVQVKPAEQCF